MSILSAWNRYRIRRYRRKLRKLEAETTSLDTNSDRFTLVPSQLIHSAATIHPGPPSSISDGSEMPGPIEVDAPPVTRRDFDRLQIEMAEQFATFRSEMHDVIHQLNVNHSTPISSSRYGTGELQYKPSYTNLEDLEESSLFTPSVVDYGDSQRHQEPEPNFDRLPLVDMMNSLRQVAAIKVLKSTLAERNQIYA